MVWGETPGSWPADWMVSEPLVVGAAPTQADAAGLNFQVRVEGFFSWGQGVPSLRVS